MDSTSFIKRRCRRSLKMDDSNISLSPLDLNSPAYRRFQNLSKQMPSCDTAPSPPSMDTRGADSSTSTASTNAHFSVFDLTPLTAAKTSLTDTPVTSMPKMSLNFDEASPSPFTLSSTSTTNRALLFGNDNENDDESSRDSGLGLLDDIEEKKNVSVTLDFSSPCILPDEGFNEDTDQQLPSGLSNLLKGELKNNGTPNRMSSKSSKPVRSGARRGLFRSVSAPLKNLESKLQSVKREGDDITEEPVIKKRRFSLATENEDQENTKPEIMPRHHSEFAIKSALSRAAVNEVPLIGDCSNEHALPLCKSKHSDLKAISPSTMKDLLNGKFDDTVGKYMIVDCRYPYEYEGGHIEGAVNLYTKTDIFEKFMSNEEYRQSSAAPNKRNILIFHCEFSSERGPKMSRFLRNKDRDANKECYPSLHYPEIYLLEGGYKNFWEQYPEKCTLNGAYKPMLHQDHGDDLKKFRAKSKTWAGEKQGRSRTALKVRF